MSSLRVIMFKKQVKPAKKNFKKIQNKFGEALKDTYLCAPETATSGRKGSDC